MWFSYLTLTPPTLTPVTYICYRKPTPYGGPIHTTRGPCFVPFIRNVLQPFRAPRFFLAQMYQMDNMRSRLKAKKLVKSPQQRLSLGKKVWLSAWRFVSLVVWAPLTVLEVTNEVKNEGVLWLRRNYRLMLAMIMGHFFGSWLTWYMGWSD